MLKDDSDAIYRWEFIIIVIIVTINQGTTTSSLFGASSWDGKTAISPPLLLSWSSSTSSSSSMINFLTLGSAPDPVLLASVLDLPHTPVLGLFTYHVNQILIFWTPLPSSAILCHHFPDPTILRESVKKWVFNGVVRGQKGQKWVKTG